MDCSGSCASGKAQGRTSVAAVAHCPNAPSICPTLIGLFCLLTGGSVCWLLRQTARFPFQEFFLSLSSILCQTELACPNLCFFPRNMLHSVTDWCRAGGNSKDPHLCLNSGQLKRPFQLQCSTMNQMSPLFQLHCSSVSLSSYSWFFYFTYEGQKELPECLCFFPVLSLLWRKIGEGRS